MTKPILSQLPIAYADLEVLVDDLWDMDTKLSVCNIFHSPLLKFISHESPGEHKVTIMYNCQLKLLLSTSFVSIQINLLRSMVHRLEGEGRNILKNCRQNDAANTDQNKIPLLLLLPHQPNSSSCFLTEDK
jgi:hypothetical protein